MLHALVTLERIGARDAASERPLRSFDMTPALSTPDVQLDRYIAEVTQHALLSCLLPATAFRSTAVVR